MCVFTPLVIPVPMVSVALERRVISSFWGVAHWNPWGRRGGERKTSKGGGWAHCSRELLWVLKLVHYFAAARTCNAVHLQPCPSNHVCAHMHISVHFVLQCDSSCALPLSPSQCPCSTFLCLFHFVSGSYHQRRLLFSLGLRLQSDSVWSSLLPPAVSSEWASVFVGDWLTESIRALTVFGIYQVHLHIFNCNHVSAVVCFGLIVSNYCGLEGSCLG